jgi:hypothetical protein
LFWFEYFLALNKIKKKLHGMLSKKQKNDFGKEVAKHLIKKNYSGTRVREEADAVNAEFDAAFKKAMAAKNPKGKTYQSRVDAGELPGSINKK